MRTSIILPALLAGSAVAKPVQKWLEERAVVVDWVTTTTVVWVTAGQPTPTPVAPVVEEPPKKQAAVAYNPHKHNHAHVKPKPAAPAPVAEQPKAEAPKAEAPKVEAPKAEAPKAEAPKAEAPKAEAPKAEAPKAPEPKQATPAPSTGSADVPTDYPANLDSSSEIYKALTLAHHNIHRSNHSADDLQWDDDLANYAMQTAKTCKYDHSTTPGGGGYGQNIAAGRQPGEIAKILTGGFYNDEIMLYPGYGNDSPDMGNFHAWGHFSQMLWTTTTKVGCYTHSCIPEGAKALDCPQGTGQSYLPPLECAARIPAIFTVCNYSPPGNFAGQYSKVKAPSGGKGIVMTTPEGVTGM
ncbi:MAG: hypothetical protein Q9174_004924 [Haloplaca sp. 1 TL-2023]